MPIHDQGYRRYAGAKQPHGRTWWVIARAGIMERLRERRFLALLLFAWAPFVVRAVQMYLAANFSQAALLAPTPATFREFLDQQGIFVFFVTIYVGAGLIANDRRANALQIYLSKPLSRVDYVSGKLVTLLVFLVAVTWVPAVLLLVLQVMFTGDTSFVGANLFLIPAITVFAAAQVMVSSFAVLALSSLSNSRRFVSIMYAGIIFFTAAMYQALRQITASTSWAWISPSDTLEALGEVVFRSSGEPAIPALVAVVAIGALLAASVWILERRVRAVEVVT